MKTIFLIFMLVNTSLFSLEAKKFEKDKRYCDDPYLSPSWMDYWNQQLTRCKEGYSIGGTKITGNHYFYLNFCKINLTYENDENIVKDRKKKLAFPDFWDGDFEYFNVVDKAREQSRHLCIGKARRKGFSYKNASICANRYNTQKNSTTIIGAYDKKYLFPTGTMSMTLDYLNFLNEYTGWAKKSQVVNKQDFRRASYKQVINGIEIEKGYKSQILAITFKDNPDAAHPYSQIVYTPKGKEIWKNIKKGSSLFDENGNVTTVTQIHEQGLQDIYELTFNDGRKIKATLHHEWEVIKRGYKRIGNKEGKGFKKYIFTTKDLINIFKTNTKSHNDIKVEIGGSVKFNSHPVPIDSYTLGIMLGDGCFVKSSNSLSYVTMMWKDIDELQSYIPFKIEHCAFDTINKKQSKIYIPNGKNIYLSLGLADKRSHNKFIPDIYKYNSENIRLGILNGLLDTDGSITKDYGVIEYCSKSEKMAKDFLWVVYSLGLGGTIKSKKINGETYYRVYIYCKPNEKRLFNLKRKKERISLKKWNKYALNKSSYIHLESIRLLEKEQAKCVTVSSNKHLYLIDDFIKTHNCRGKDASLILLEEAGKFPNLKAAYLATKPSVEDGIYTTGQIIIYGTSGSMEQGGTLDFYELFYNPEPYNIMSFENIWDDNEHGRCGYFVPDYKNKVGFIDKDGNSDMTKAREYEEARRQAIARKSKDKKTLTRHITEYPFTPREAFFLSTANIFPVADLKHRLGYLESNEKIRNADYIGELIVEEEGKVKWKENTKLVPITEFPLKHNTITEGCIVIYNMPYTDENDKVPFGMYLGGTDPYSQDQAESGSLGSTFIYDKINKKLVAEYTARPATSKVYYENVKRLLMFYNCRSLYENQIKGIFDYFESKYCLHLLADEPGIIHDIIQDSRVIRKKGMHMTDALKDYGENLINQWLLEEREDGMLNLHKIRSIPLLKELISYNKNINTDRVIGFMMCLYYEAELRKQKVSKSTEVETILDDPFWSRNLYKSVVTNQLIY